jgi:NAD(P)-dependent dehydrogenase (short-subunit alcohol dehydrogenase family)
MENPFSLKDKTILVTGASSGIGRQIAISVNQAGADVIINGRDKERLEQTFLKLNGKNNLKFEADLADEPSINELVSKLPNINGVVHAAGILEPFPVRFIGRKQIDHMFTINYFAPVLLISKLLKQKKIIDGASLIFITSVSGSSKPYFGGALYASSKAALEAFSRSVALEHCSQKIRANCISPAIVITPIFDEYIGGIVNKDNFEEHEKKYPLGFGTPADIANAAIYLLSDASKWVTGTVMVLDGGQSFS